jgi:DNA-binding NtrC family response regulator
MNAGTAVKDDSSPALAQMAQKKRTILLVEDEELVNSLLSEVLQRHGYDVLSCSHPQTGIELCRSRPDEIDLLLTDMIMPGMNGREMVSRIVAGAPKLRVIFMSGAGDQVPPPNEEAGASIGFLQKPFSLAALVGKLEEMFGEDPMPVR